MIRMFLCSAPKKEKNKIKRANPLAFKVFQQLQEVYMESYAHIKCVFKSVRYTLYISMLTFVSVVVF